MSETTAYTPKFLSQSRPMGFDAETEEVLELVKKNPTRKVDSEHLPPMRINKDGRIYLDDSPTVGEMFAFMCYLFCMTISVVAGMAGLAYAIVTGTIPLYISAAAYIAAMVAAFCANIYRRGDRS